MENKIFNQLQPNDYVKHKRYGVSVVKEFIPEFGVVIFPRTRNGELLLYFDAKTADMFKDSPLGTPFLEDNPKEIERYIFKTA